jgi:hypothetical protein
MTTKFWGKKGIATKLRGQLLLCIQAALYHTSDVHGHTEYIKLVDNGLADLLLQSESRPVTFSLVPAKAIMLYIPLTVEEHDVYELFP